MTLDTLDIGQKARITSINGTPDVKKRLLDLGLTPNTVITLFKKAPLNDPIEIIVRGYHLTLRLKSAMLIEVVC